MGSEKTDYCSEYYLDSASFYSAREAQTLYCAVPLALRTVCLNRRRKDVKVYEICLVPFKDFFTAWHINVLCITLTCVHMFKWIMRKELLYSWAALITTWQLMPHLSHYLFPNKYSTNKFNENTAISLSCCYLACMLITAGVHFTCAFSIKH